MGFYTPINIMYRQMDAIRSSISADSIQFSFNLSDERNIIHTFVSEKLSNSCRKRVVWMKKLRVQRHRTRTILFYGLGVRLGEKLRLSREFSHFIVLRIYVVYLRVRILKNKLSPYADSGESVRIYSCSVYARIVLVIYSGISREFSLIFFVFRMLDSTFKTVKYFMLLQYSNFNVADYVDSFECLSNHFQFCLKGFKFVLSDRNECVRLFKCIWRHYSVFYLSVRLYTKRNLFVE